MKNKLFVLPVLMVLVTVFVSCGAKQPENGMEADNYSNKEILAMRKVYTAVSYTHLRAHETVLDLVCRLLLEKKKKEETEHVVIYIICS